MRKHRLILSALALGTALASPARAQQVDSGAFIVRLGRDTIAVERYVRTPLQLVAEGTLRTPQTRRYKLNITFKDSGAISWFEVINAPVAGVPGSVPIMRNVGTYLGDSVRIETWVSAVPRMTRSVAAKSDVVPLQLPFYSTYETMLMRARKSASDTLTVAMLAGSSTLSYLVHWIAPDSVTLFHPQGGTIKAHTDPSGRILGLSGEASTFKVVVTRAKWFDLDAYEKRVAAAEAKGQGIGPLSPRDSLEFDVGTSSGMISYGRPSKRGRVIFGALVPWGEVWRTGANQATEIQFVDSVEIHGVAIPPGTYSLWTIPDPKQWQLIINKQTGQWGTNYDPKQDLARIPVRSERIPVPVETFTIGGSNKADGTAVMTLTWDRTRVLIPIKPLKH